MSNLADGVMTAIFLFPKTEVPLSHTIRMVSLPSGHPQDVRGNGIFFMEVAYEDVDGIS